jgi:hypothetical protein
LCGREFVNGFQDGAGADALFSYPSGLVCDSNAEFAYLCDSDNHSIRRLRIEERQQLRQQQQQQHEHGGIALSAFVDTIAGHSGQMGFVDGLCREGAVRFNRPEALALDHDERMLFIADSDNNAIRCLSLHSLMLCTVTGGHGRIGFFDGSLLLAQFARPMGIAVDRNGVLAVADSNNQCVRLVSIANDLVTTVAGRDGTFSFPTALCIHPISGDLYVSDSSNNVVRQIARTGLVGALAPQAIVALRLLRAIRVLVCAVPPSAIGDRKRSVMRLVVAALAGPLLTPAQVLAIERYASSVRTLRQEQSKPRFLRLVLSPTSESSGQLSSSSRRSPFVAGGGAAAATTDYQSSVYSSMKKRQWSQIYWQS